MSENVPSELHEEIRRNEIFLIDVREKLKLLNLHLDAIEKRKNELRNEEKMRCSN